MAADEDEDGSTSTNFKYDVFLSFRGHTRLGFTDCLYHALIREGVEIFRDNPKLELGDEISQTLLDAIEKSRMSVVVLCQNFAFSTWCLRELVKIMKCSEKGKPVFPVFYLVEPTVVRYQKKQYGEAMIIHEERHGIHPEEVTEWRSALFAICKLKGEHCVKDLTKEGEVIAEIVKKVLSKRVPTPLHINSTLGSDSRLEKAKALLDIEFHDNTRILVIFGDGETNLATFAVELYSKINHQFEAASFLNEVCKKSKESNGLENLQKTLLSEMGEEIKTKIGSTFKGSYEIKRSLCHKRVLLVLQGVDTKEQFDSLAGGGDWFGRGSRIIITTRNEDVLLKHVKSKNELEGVEIKEYCIDEGDFEGMEAPILNSKQRWDVEDGDVVGFDVSLSTVINQLKKEDPFRNVVSITGMGGLGKTTLAEKIYEENEVKQLFPLRAWSCVSKDFNERRVFLDLLGCLKSSTSRYENLSEEKLKEEVRKCLNKNKYLVVLDDIWEPKVWNKLKGVFPNNNNGSLILITSRYDAVAYYTRSRNPHHKLTPLDEEKSWELFCRKVFGREDCPRHLEPIGKSIVERCGGLPLAIITIAGLVAHKEESYAEWSHIKDFVPWYLTEDDTNVMDVLKVSYDNLSANLKPCFLYFGIYPEDHKIPARDLIQLWMAEGFIQPEETRASKVPRPEVVGENYLKELVDRNLVQVAKRRSDGGLKTCCIHDLLREFCILESKSDSFLEVCTESTNNSLSNSCRLSLLCNEQRYMPLIKCSQPSTRSLFFFAGQSYPTSILKDFPSVHVLHVARRVPFTKGPSDLEKMIKLKYLRIEPGNCVRGIPNWIWSLNNLETLDLRGWFTTGSTLKIWKLERLKHLFTRMYVSLEVYEEGANSKKIMWNLQTLTTVEVEPKSMHPINSGSFPNLSKLSLSYDPRSNYLLHEQLQNLHHLSNLRTLKLECCSGKITLDGIVFPSRISKVTLKYLAKLDSSLMSALGRITSLRILKLVDGTTSTYTLDIRGDFPKLHMFHIDRFSKVRRLTLEDGAMPQLQHMVIRRCDDLKVVPERLFSLCDSQDVLPFSPSCSIKGILLTTVIICFINCRSFYKFFKRYLTLSHALSVLSCDFFPCLCILSSFLLLLLFLLIMF